MRVQVVKQHYITKGNYTAAGYFDGSLEEKAEKDGDESVKRLINSGLRGSSVTCVLIGAKTYTRRWVDYEILKSVELGMGVFGIRVHQIADAGRVRETLGGKDNAGFNPFYYLGYGRRESKLVPMIRYTAGWKRAPNLDLISEGSAQYLIGEDRPILSSLFSVHDWVADNGYLNFDDWVEAAANQAGR